MDSTREGRGETEEIVDLRGASEASCATATLSPELLNSERSTGGLQPAAASDARATMAADEIR